MIHEAALQYTGAVADGELDLVPAESLAHIRSCSVCAVEVRWQREVNLGLAGALAAEAAEEQPLAARVARRRWQRLLPAPALVAGIAAAAVLVATAGVLSLGRHGGGHPAQNAETLMAAAAHAYGSPPSMATSDPRVVAGWTAAHGLGEVTPPTVEGASLTGVRGWSVDGAQAATFVYSGVMGQTEVTELGGPPPPGWPMSETRMMDGRAVGVVGHGNSGMVIVAPDETGLARAMSAVQ
ncbi:MAG: hypothetical protein ACR2MY_13605 [Candidatus Dormibacteria bacterium]